MENRSKGQPVFKNMKYVEQYKTSEPFQRLMSQHDSKCRIQKQYLNTSGVAPIINQYKVAEPLPRFIRQDDFEVSAIEPIADEKKIFNEVQTTKAKARRKIEYGPENSHAETPSYMSIRTSTPKRSKKHLDKSDKSNEMHRQAEKAFNLSGEKTFQN